MANKFVDQNGLLYFWQKLLAKFQQKEENKGLSSNDYTNEEKEKLKGIKAEANKTTIVDDLTSDASDAALSAKQGKVLKGKIDAINTNLEELGAGDMLKSVYDVDGDNIVDVAKNAKDAEMLGSKTPDQYAEAGHIHGNATTEKDGFISKEDKAKLDGIEEGANKYTLPNATAAVLGGIKVGENLSITEDGVLSADAQHIDVDDALSAESVNPVQNKIVKAALDEKVAKEEGKGLSSNDYTTAEKTKLEGIEDGANNYTHPDSHAATMITEDATHRFATDDEKTSWNGKIDSSTKGQANGVATLDENGLIPSTQLPSYVDDVIEGYADVTVTEVDSTSTVVVNGFYLDKDHKTAVTGESGKIYVDVETNLSYRWGGTTYVQITSSDCAVLTNKEIDDIVATTV